MKKKEKKIIYYNDLLNDEFSTAVIAPKVIDGNYKYIYDKKIKKFTHFFWYRIVATPIAFLYLKIKFKHKIVNGKLLKKAHNEGYFIFGNHTQDIADAFIPSMLCYPKHAYVIVNPENVSMPYLGKITPSLGAIPLPSDVQAYRNFLSAVKTRVEQGCAVFIYPEAHIWPFYTDIRPFIDKSFYYPIKYKKPVFCFTNTYQIKKEGGTVRIVTYVDGPFLPDENFKSDEQRSDLRNRVYSAMKERSANNNVEVIKYIKREGGESD